MGLHKHYVWDHWLNGDTHVLVHGTDAQVAAGVAQFTANPDSFLLYARRVAADRGLALRARTGGAVVEIRAVPREEGEAGSRSGRRPKYAWRTWFDGAVHLLRPGLDFPVGAHAFRAQVYTAARTHGIRVTVRVLGDSLAVQAVGRRDAGAGAEEAARG